MGCHIEAVCDDCKVRASLGYGCGSTWLTARVDTVAQFDQCDENLKTLAKNQRWREFLADHEGHDFFTWNDDYASVRNGILEYDDNLCEPLDLSQYRVNGSGRDPKQGSGADGSV